LCSIKHLWNGTALCILIKSSHQEEKLTNDRRGMKNGPIKWGIKWRQVTLPPWAAGQKSKVGWMGCKYGRGRAIKGRSLPLPSPSVAPMLSAKFFGLNGRSAALAALAALCFALQTSKQVKTKWWTSWQKKIFFFKFPKKVSYGGKQEKKHRKPHPDCEIHKPYSTIWRKF
jgi:hypothetical protein